ncbi:MAG: hypothetical protein II782_03905, partial [Oscillospiraceae bacterium]|nr:hypothetical protein [Oscillospiraceae bacterium]
QQQQKLHESWYKMKELFRSIKLFFRISFFLPTTVISLAIFVFALYYMLIYKSPLEGYDEHMLFLIMYSSSHVAVVSFFAAGMEKSRSCKFLSSTSYARSFATVVPAVSAAMLSIVLDIVMCIMIAVYKPELGAADSLIVNAPTGIFLCFIASAMDKPPLYPLCFGGFIAYIWLSKKIITMYFEPDGWSIKYGFGLPVPAAFIAALLIYAAGTALNILILDIWWKKIGRYFSNNDGGAGDSAAIRRLFTFIGR